MKIRCDSCRKQFEATKAQKKEIESARRNGRSFMLLICGVCHMGTPYRPFEKIQQLSNEPPEPLLRCPVPCCTGFVTPIQESKKIIQCCGECGSVWKKLDSVYKEIASIVRAYPYRRKCYRKRGEQWLPAPGDKEPENYDELVESEKAEKKPPTVRR